METQGLQGPRIALLIDFDNVVLGVEDPPGFDVELIVNALRSRGVVVLGRAYGDWYRHSRHRRKLMEQGIELVETPAFGPIIKNSADIRIALDGFEIGMTQHHITEFCLVSGDSDFLPLIKRLQYLGKSVVVISGVKFTSELVRRNCNEFISYENLLAESVGATEDATILEGAFTLLSRTINTLHERGMEIRSSTVKQMMLQLNPTFSERNFGCSQFKQFLDKGCRAGVIKLGRRDPNSGEWTVLLPSDDDDLVADETPEVKPTRGRRTRAAAPPAPPRVQAAGEDLGLHDLAGEATEEAAESTSATNGGSNGTAEQRALRRGRLRFSGKTWKAGSRSVIQPKEGDASDSVEGGSEASEENVPEVNTAQPEAMTLEPELFAADAAPEATESAPAESGADVETAGEAVAEEKPKSRRGTRGGRRRKITKAEDAEGAAAAETTSPAETTPVTDATTAEAITPVAISTQTRKRASSRSKTASQPAVESSGEEQATDEKAAATKPVRRRRAPAKKKAEK